MTSILQVNSLRLSKDTCPAHDHTGQTACKTSAKAPQLHDSPRKHIDAKPKGRGHCAGQKVFEPGEKVYLSLDLWSFPKWKTFILNVF